MITRRGATVKHSGKPMIPKSSIPVPERKPRRNVAQQVAATSVSGSNVTNQMNTCTENKRNCQMKSEKLTAQSKVVISQARLAQSLRTEVLKKDFNSGRTRVDKVETEINPPLAYSLRPRKSEFGSIYQDKNGCSVDNKNFPAVQQSECKARSFAKTRKSDQELICNSPSVLNKKPTIRDETFVVPTVPRTRSQKRSATELSLKSENPTVSNKHQRLLTVIQPCSSSTPVRNVFRNSTHSGMTCLPVLHLSPIKKPESEKKPSTIACKKVAAKRGKENQQQNRPTIVEQVKIKSSSCIKQNHVVENKANGPQNVSSKESNDYTKARDYTRVRRKEADNSCNGSTGTDSNSGECDPLLLFCLKDPIKLSTISKPKVKTCNSHKDKFDDLWASSPVKQLKTNPKKDPKADNPLYQDRMRLWLEEVEQFNAEMNMVEKMELCVE